MQTGPFVYILHAGASSRAISKVVISLQRIPEMAVECGLADPVIAAFRGESRETHTYALVT